MELIFQKNIFFQSTAFSPVEASLPMKEHLRECILRTIGTSEDLGGLRSGLVDLFNELNYTGLVSKQSSDQSICPYFVSLQGIIEQNLAIELQNGKVKNLIGIIHTPTPATPLCTNGDISEKLVDSSLLADNSRLFTVKARADIVRDFLDLGGKLYVVYPRGGLEKRTIEQQNIYHKILKNYSNNLFDSKLESSSIDHDLVGASYLFEDELGDQYLFSLRACQANAPTTDQAWSMWYGKVSESHIAQRLECLKEFLSSSGGPVFERSNNSQN
ncbi:MAG: hypothetical protein S4CHLAM6_01450 [Chlamydiae bacterium]|nr:hypothetical protein [Chlamydiota bacterium]